MTRLHALARSIAVAIVALLLLVGAAWAGNAISGREPASLTTEQVSDVDDGDEADVEDQDEAGDVDDGDQGELDD